MHLFISFFIYTDKNNFVVKWILQEKKCNFYIEYVISGKNKKNKFYISTYSLNL